MSNCSCGAVDHMDQVELYPVGTKAHLRIYGIATVTGHCDDGRAVFDVGEAGHTFHAPDGWVIEVLNLPKPTKVYDYKVDLATMAQEEILTMKDLEGILDAAEGLCDEIIRSQTKPDDIDYTASQLITVISQFKAWNDLSDLPAE